MDALNRQNGQSVLIPPQKVVSRRSPHVGLPEDNTSIKKKKLSQQRHGVLQVLIHSKVYLPNFLSSIGNADTDISATNWSRTDRARRLRNVARTSETPCPLNCDHRLGFWGKSPFIRACASLECSASCGEFVRRHQHSIFRFRRWFLFNFLPLCFYLLVLLGVFFLCVF